MTHKKHGSTSAAYLRHYDFVLDFSYIFIYYIQKKKSSATFHFLLKIHFCTQPQEQPSKRLNQYCLAINVDYSL